MPITVGKDFKVLVVAGGGGGGYNWGGGGGEIIFEDKDELPIGSGVAVSGKGHGEVIVSSKSGAGGS
jgi:hypothetical protein